MKLRTSLFVAAVGIVVGSSLYALPLTGRQDHTTNTAQSTPNFKAWYRDGSTSRLSPFQATNEHWGSCGGQKQDGTCCPMGEQARCKDQVCQCTLTADCTAECNRRGNCKKRGC
jgi:hypothetical protein